MRLASLLAGCLERAGGGALTLAGEVPGTLLGDPPRLSLIVDRTLGALAPAPAPVVLSVDATATPASDGWYVVRIEARAQPAPAAAPGLRLAIARGLATALGGQLAIDTTAGTATLIAPLAGVQPSDS